MPFRIETEDSVGEQVRRVLLEQVDKALEALSDGATKRGVHEARKACKRARATAALVRSGLGKKQTKGVDRAFRDAARHIGPVRDADVMREHLASLGGEPDAVDDPEDREALGEQAVAGLEAARTVVQALDVSGVELSVAVIGLVRSARDTRSGMRDARKAHTAEAFHEWRKAVKRYGYHLQLLAPLAPDVLGAALAGVDALQELLGHHHDLAVLQEEGGEASTAVRASLEARAEQLERQALALGAWWFAASPRVVGAYLAARSTGID